MGEEQPQVAGRPDLDGKELWTVKRYSSARHAAKFYQVMALLTGTFLVILTFEMIYKYLIAPDPATALIVGNFNLAAAIAICHGWCYVVYLISDFWLWQQMKWKIGDFLIIALAGVVPFMSFFLERRISRRVERELDEAVVVAPTRM